MRKSVLYIIIAVCCVSVAQAHVVPKASEISHESIILDVEQNLDLAKEVFELKQRFEAEKSTTYYFHIDVIGARLYVYRLIFGADGTPGLEFVEDLEAGTPQKKLYPKGFGIITKITKRPSWAPTPDTVKEFKKRGINLEQFRNEDGKIIVPSGHKLNYMGEAKMEIRFVTPQKNAKLERNVYRIHGTLPKLEYKLGTRCSSGCIRLRNDKIERVANMTKGAAIIIQYI
jgi:hypothetical protein